MNTNPIRIAFAVIVLAAGLCAPSQAATPVFAAPVTYNTGTQGDIFVPNAEPAGVVTGIFRTGSGKLDIIEAHGADNSLYYLAGNGDGTFKPAVKIAISESIGTIPNVFTGDFNGDGNLDLFLPSGDVHNCHPIILLGNGDGTFKAPIDSSSFNVPGAPSQAYARGWVVGDFNNDGKLDIACSVVDAGDGGTYTVLLGNGDGTFKAGLPGPLTSTIHYPRWIAAGDFNRDGKLDLAIADGQQHVPAANGADAGDAELTILLGNGDGTFRLAGQYPSPNTAEGAFSNPEDVFVADLGKRGILDCIVSNYDGNINVFRGNGDGTFQPAAGYSTGEYPRAVAVADLDGDGKLDLVVGDVGIGVGGALFSEGYMPSAVVALMGNGDGTFQSPVPIATPFYYSGWLVVGNFGTGLPGIAVEGRVNDHSIAVLQNRTGQRLTVASQATASPNPATVGQTLTFSVNAADPDGDTLTYSWAFGDGATATGQTVTHAYAAGHFLAMVTVTDGRGDSTASSVGVEVSRLTLTTAATATPNPAKVNQAIAFTVAATDPDGDTIPNISWDFGDGGSADGASASHAYAAAGTYTATVKLVDNNGDWIESSVVVTVTNNNPGLVITSAATAAPNPAAVNQTISLVAGASDADGDTLTYAWTFGDGAGGSGATVSHAYLAAGTYTASVTVSDGNGSTANSSVQITVTPVSGGDPSLVGYWKFDEGSGNTAADSSGTGNNGTFVGIPAWTVGKVNGALSFGSNAYVSVPDTASLNSDQLTVAGWIRSNNPGTPVQQWIIGKQAATRAFAFKLVGGRVQYFMGSGSASAGAWGNTVLQANQWYYVAATYDGAAIKIYVNGALDATQPAALPAGWNTAQTLTLGGLNSQYIASFNGVLDEIRMYNRALSATEIQALGSATAASGAALPPATQLSSVKLAGSANFHAQGQDTATLSGVIPNVPAGFDPTNLPIIVSIGDASVQFTLDKAGKAKTANGAVALKLKVKRDKSGKAAFPGGNVPFTAKLIHGTWGSSAWNMNPQETTANKPVLFTAMIELGNTVYTSSVNVKYSSKANVGAKFTK